MNFTNSPYERMMKEIPHYEKPVPQKAPKGSPCAECPYWRGIVCVFAIKSTARSRADVLALGLRYSPSCNGFQSWF